MQRKRWSPTPPTFFYNLSFFFDFSASINLKTASKSSAKKFDTSPLGTTWWKGVQM